MPDSTPATKQDIVLLQQDIAELREATKQDVAKLQQDIGQLSETLVEQMRDMQTEVLRAFLNWARPADVKFRSHEERLAILEERVFALERGEFPRSQ